LIELVLRIGFSLLIVFGLMWGLAKVARRPLTGGRGAGNLTVLQRQQLSRGSSVAVIKVADRALIIGVTDTQVSLLGETDLDVFEHKAHAERRDAVPIDPAAALGPAGDDGVRSPVARAPGRLDGSLLSSRTWTSTLDFIRDRTTRR
jgi:flagellar protein FliO/FliZ